MANDKPTTEPRRKLQSVWVAHPFAVPTTGGDPHHIENDGKRWDIEVTGKAVLFHGKGEGRALKNSKGHTFEVPRHFTVLHWVPADEPADDKSAAKGAK